MPVTRTLAIEPAALGAECASSPTRKRFDHGEPISRIDTRPMVFVFVIVGLFVMLWNLNQERTHTLLVDLPHGSPSRIENPSIPHVTVEVTRAGTLILDSEPVELEGLSQAIRAKKLTYPVVLFSADGDAGYGIAALALNEISKAGIEPDEICFLGLEEHRMLQSAGFVRAHTIIPSDEGSADWKRANDIAPSGCSLFFEYGPVS